MASFLIYLISYCCSSSYCQSMESSPTYFDKVIEIRTYTLKPGMRAQFEKLVVEKSMPMLSRWRMEVVAHGPSLHDMDSYYLIRVFKDLKDMTESEDRFYGSNEWKYGPRESILACIESYSTLVLPANDILIEQLKMSSKASK